MVLRNFARDVKGVAQVIDEANDGIDLRPFVPGKVPKTPEGCPIIERISPTEQGSWRFYTETVQLAAALDKPTLAGDLNADEALFERETVRAPPT